MSSELPEVKYTVNNPSPQAPQYEFNQDQSNLIATLAGRMSLVGLVGVIAGAVFIAVAVWLAARANGRPGGIPPEVMGAAIREGVNGLFALTVGIWTRRAAAAFEAIASTRGRDISNLMDGLATLNKIYGLMYYLIILTVLFGIAAMVIAIAASGGAQPGGALIVVPEGQ